MNWKSYLKKIAGGAVIVLFIGLFVGIAFFAQGDLAEIVNKILLVIIFVFVSIIISAFLGPTKFNKETRRITKILTEDVDVEGYIRELQQAVNRTRNKTYKLYFSLDLAVGYSSWGEYQRAIDHMLGINIKDTRNIVKALYYNNLAYFYCEAGNVEAAVQTYLCGEQFINKLPENSESSATVLHTKGVIEYLSGHLSESEELLEKSKLQRVVNSHFMTSVNVYLAKIYIQTGRREKAKLLLEYNMMQRLLPNIEMETKKLMENINL